jgi:hypothetical protein
MPVSDLSGFASGLFLLIYLYVFWLFDKILLVCRGDIFEPLLTNYQGHIMTYAARCLPAATAGLVDLLL